MQHEEDTERTLDRTTFEARSRAAAGLTLVIIGDGFVESHPLPNKGTFTIGRAETNQAAIDHELMSREHARLELGDEIRLHDLGSRNGTFVRGDRLEPSSTRVIHPGQLFVLGNTSFLIQRGRSSGASARLLTHDAFLARLETRCAAARGRGDAFAVARLHVADGVSPAAVQRGLASAETIAAYAPGEYELIADSEATVQALLRGLIDTLERNDDVRFGVAVHPRDGRGAQQLMDVACRGVFEGREDQSAAPIIIDDAMRDLYRIGERVAQGSIAVLLLGETGVGKEVFAEAIHNASPRRAEPFVKLNCAAFTTTLLESELFGHEKGAFTGATERRIGLLESANGGTVMLDEVGEMSLETQAKLLRVLEQRQVVRVGGVRPVDIDVRFVSATNRDLEQEILAGTFRQDVYFRLNGATLMIPPLRERPGEVEALAKRFAEQTSREMGWAKAPALSAAALDLLVGYSWPGNIRELKNVMARAVLLAEGDEIEVKDLPHEKMALPWDVEDSPAAAGSDSDERKKILDALEACAGNQTRAAKLLGIGRRTLTTKLTKYGIRRPRKRQ